MKTVTWELLRGIPAARVPSRHEKQDRYTCPEGSESNTFHTEPRATAAKGWSFGSRCSTALIAFFCGLRSRAANGNNCPPCHLFLSREQISGWNLFSEAAQSGAAPKTGQLPRSPPTPGVAESRRKKAREHCATSPAPPQARGAGETADARPQLRATELESLVPAQAQESASLAHSTGTLTPATV